jgi:hypothetical protein
MIGLKLYWSEVVPAQLLVGAPYDIMLVFLDFDAVLRRNQSPLYKLDTDCVAIFESALRSLPDAQIVITSSWRDAFSLSQMRALFSADIAERIVGVTPSEWSHEAHYRHGEVLAFLQQDGYADANWVAVDDDPSHYTPLGNLIVVDAERGFDSEAAKRLANAVRELPSRSASKDHRRTDCT